MTSAFESTSDRVLEELEKGHQASDLERAVDITRRHGVALRPTWVAFTPWGGIDDYVAMLDFVERHGLQAAAPPVQYALRLLLPAGSPLVPRLSAAGRIEGFDRERLSHVWRHADPRVERLAADAESVVASDQGSCGRHESRRAALTSAAVLGALRSAAARAAGGPRPAALTSAAAPPFVPGLTEAWFC